MVRKVIEDSVVRFATMATVVVLVSGWCWWAGAKLEHIDCVLQAELDRQTMLHAGLDKRVEVVETRVRYIELARPVNAGAKP